MSWRADGFSPYPAVFGAVLNFCEVIMSELDPVTFLIATELLAGSDTNSSHRRTALVSHHMVSSPTLILLADCSNNEPGWSESFEDLSLHAQRDFGPDSVRLAYLQFNSPSLSDVVEDLLSHRIHQVRILPLFLSGMSLAGDIALQIRALEERYSALEIELLPAIDEDPRFQRLLWQMVRENALPEWLAKSS
jgi:sirohydrochlorin cobaltochelatase